MNPTTNNIPTPRTEAAQFGTGRVSVDFARTLERENIALREMSSSGICSVHQVPDPLNCSTCNQVAVLTDANLTRMEKIDALTIRIKELEAEVERLKTQNDIYRGDVNHIAKDRQDYMDKCVLLEKTICELREALKKFGSGVDFFSWGKAKAHLPVPLAKELTQMQYKVDELLASTPSEISSRWVKREVLEKVYRIAKGQFTSQSEVDEALTLARAELGKGEK
jgi:hypothetical protein